MKLWLLSDSHFGKYNNQTDKWLNNMISYFYDFYIPTLKANMKPGDKMCFLGDLYDNRTSINIKVFNAVIKLFEDLSKIIEIHMLIGNHDQYNMSDAEINSVSTIRNINNVFIYDEPTIRNFGGKEILLMPWIHGKNDEKSILERYSGSDVLLCHSDLNGCRTQLYPTRPHNRNILDIEDFKGFNKVYSGHIHINQTINNFTFVGCPYHLDRNDINNEKGIWVYNTKNNKDVFIENDYSPQFKKIKIESENDLINLNESIMTNNYVDLIINKSIILNDEKIKLKIEKAINKYSPNDVQWNDDIVKDKKTYIVKSNQENKTIKDWSKEWVDNLIINQETDMFKEIDFKAGMKREIDKCFNILQEQKGI